SIKKALGDCREMYGPVPDGISKWPVLYRPVNPLKDPKLVASVGRWSDVVAEMTAFGGADPDKNLRVIRKCHLIRGVQQSENGHAFIATQGRTRESLTSTTSQG
ncbi:MAG TPA: hypothetical protein VFE91_01710, partial [Nitrososphaerales archaeon]|nr:hypothetical protein [Nitrososphaerales archaeon]